MKYRWMISLLAALALAGAPHARAAESAGYPDLILLGDLEFDTGGMPVTALIGSFVKTIDPVTGVFVYQDVDGVEQTGTISVGEGGGLTAAQAQAIVGAMFTDNVETGGITLVYNSGTQKIDVTITLTDSDIPPEIARDAELPSDDQLLPTGGVPGDVLTRVGASDAAFDTPVGDGVVESGEVTGTTLTLRRSGSLSDVQVTGLPTPGEVTSDGVVTGGSATLDELALQRSEGLGNVVVPLEREVVEPDANGQLPTAQPSDLGRFARDGLNLRVVTEVHHSLTSQSVTFADYSATGFLGLVHACAATFPSAAVSSTCFDLNSRSWYIRRLGHWSSVGANPTGWIGAKADRETAEQQVGAINDLVWWTGETAIHRVTAIVPAGTDVTEYPYLPQPEMIEVLNRPALPEATSADAGQIPKVNASGDYTLQEDDGGAEITVNPVGALIVLRSIGIDGTDYRMPDEIEELTPARVSLFGGDVNHYEFLNASIPTTGKSYRFDTLATNTGLVMVRINSSDYAVLKAGELPGTEETFEGGEWHNGIVQEIVWTGSGFSWIGTLLGNAAQRDVGPDEGELAPLNSLGQLPTQAMPEATDNAVTFGQVSGRVLTANNIDALFNNDPIEASNPTNENEHIGATQRRIAEAFLSLGVTGVSISGTGNIITISTTRPNGSASTSDFDLSQTDDLSRLEQLLADLIEATGFHPGHDLILADVIDRDNIVNEDISIVNNASKIHHSGGSINMITYSNAAGTEGIYYNEERIGDLPPIQSAENYGGGVRISVVGPFTAYVWVNGDNLSMRELGGTTVWTANWRTLLAAPSPNWIALAIDTDELVQNGRLYMLLYNTANHTTRLGALVLARASGTGELRLAGGASTYVDLTLEDINTVLPDEKFQARTTGYSTQDRDGIVDIAVSRDVVWLYMAGLAPNPAYTQANFLSYLLAYEISFTGAQVQLLHNADLAAEIQPGIGGISAEVVKHPNIDALEDAYTHTGTDNIWHYRDPDQLSVRWENVTEKPSEATVTEMELGSENSIRLMSPQAIAQAIMARGIYRGPLAPDTVYRPGDMGEATTGFYYLRTGSAGSQLPADDLTQWHSLNGTQLGANQVTAINDILKRLPRDVTIMAQRDEPQSTVAGWLSAFRYDLTDPLGIGSISEEPHEHITGFAWWGPAAPMDVFQNRFVLETNEAASGRAYDGKKVRYAGNVYTLEYQERSASEYNRYRTTVEIENVPFPADTKAARVSWSVNFEDVDEDMSETIGGPPWDFYLAAGTPLSDGGVEDAGVDDVVNNLALTLVGTNQLRVTAGRTVGADIVSNDLTLPAGGGGTADGVVASATLAITGQALVLTLDRSIGADVTANVALPRLVLNTLPNQSSSDLASHDLLLVEDTSNAHSQEHLTVGSLVASMADGTSITASDGVLSAVVGGGGTDDQTAAEVPVTATGFDGNLSPTDNNMQLVAQAVDDLALGGGGGGPLSTTTTDIPNITFTEGVNVAIDITATNSAVDTGIAVPANTKTILLNYGAATTMANSGIDLPWFAIPIEEWDRLDAVDAGDTPTVGNSRFTRTWLDNNVTLVGGVQARQVWYGKGNNGNIFVWSDNTGWDIHPFRVRFEIHTPVTVVTEVTGGGGGGGEGDGDITAVNTASTSGLSGGVESGDADLRVNMTGVSEITSLSTTNLVLMQRSDGALRTASVLTLNSAFRPERGQFSNTEIYPIGDIVETGSGDNLIFWIAARYVSAGHGEPTQANGGAEGRWYELAFRGSWRGELIETETYDLYEGDTYHIGDEVYSVTQAVENITGLELREHDHIEELSNPLFQDEGVTLTGAESVRFINITGAGATATLDALGVATINIPGSTGGGGIRIEEGGTERIASADAIDFNSDDFQTNIVQDPELGLSIAPALTRDDEVEDAFEAVNVAGRVFTFDQIGGGSATATVPLVDITADYPTRTATISVQDLFLLSDFDNGENTRHTTGFDVRAFAQIGLENACVDIDYSGSILTCTQFDGGTDTVTIAGGGTADGVADSLAFGLNGNVLTLTLGRSIGDDLADTFTLPAFDIHDDISTLGGTLQGVDRFIYSDESVTGDPNRYTTALALYNGMRDVVTSQHADQLPGFDRIYLSAESVNGDPIQYMTATNFFNGIYDVVTTSDESFDDADRLYYAATQLTGDPLRYTTMGGLRTYMHGGLLAASIPDLGAGKITTGILPIARGGTGSGTAAGARTALGITNSSVLGGLGIDVDTSGIDYTVNQDIDSLTALPDIADDDTLAAFDLSANTIRKVRAADLESEIRIHRGAYDTAVEYQQGWIIETGTDASKLFWIASTVIAAGQPEPSLVDPHNWWLLATPNHFRQELDQTTTHNFIDGDWFRVGNRVFLATAELNGITGADLLGGHDNVVELTSPCQYEELLAWTSVTATQHFSAGLTMTRDLVAADDQCRISFSIREVYAVPLNDGTRYFEIDGYASDYRALTTTATDSFNPSNTLRAQMPRCGDATNNTSKFSHTAWYVGRSEGDPDSVVLSNVHWDETACGNSTWAVRVVLD